MAAFSQHYAELKTSWDGFAGYDAWASRTNNASLGALSAYDKLVTDFEALFEQEGRDWPRFYAAVKRIAALPKAERHAALRRDEL
jgi:predicted aminopeptidase